MKVRIGKPIPYNNNIDEMIENWSNKVAELSKDTPEKKKPKKEKKINYAQKSASAFNILTRLYQYYALYILFLPLFGFTFYKFNIKRNNELQNKQYIYAPNHISYMDVFLVNLAANRPLAYMAKQELFQTNSWLQCWVTRNILRLGAFAVNREKVALSTIKTVKEVFRAKYNLCIFPQGGIRKNKIVEKINPGFIYFAKVNKIDIVPIGLCGLETYNWKLFNKQKVDVVVGKPISYKLDEEEIVNEWCKQISELTGYENKNVI